MFNSLIGPARHAIHTVSENRSANHHDFASRCMQLLPTTPQQSLNRLFCCVPSAGSMRASSMNSASIFLNTQTSDWRAFIEAANLPGRLNYVPIKDQQAFFLAKLSNPTQAQVMALLEQDQANATLEQRVKNALTELNEKPVLWLTERSAPAAASEDRTAFENREQNAEQVNQSIPSIRLLCASETASLSQDKALLSCVMQMHLDEHTDDAKSEADLIVTNFLGTDPDNDRLISLGTVLQADPQTVETLRQFSQTSNDSKDYYLNALTTLLATNDRTDTTQTNSQTTQAIAQTLPYDELEHETLKILIEDTFYELTPTEQHAIFEVLSGDSFTTQGHIETAAIVHQLFIDGLNNRAARAEPISETSAPAFNYREVLAEKITQPVIDDLQTRGTSLDAPLVVVGWGCGKGEHEVLAKKTLESKGYQSVQAWGLDSADSQFEFMQSDAELDGKLMGDGVHVHKSHEAILKSRPGEKIALINHVIHHVPHVLQQQLLTSVVTANDAQYVSIIEPTNQHPPLQQCLHWLQGVKAFRGDAKQASDRFTAHMMNSHDIARNQLHLPDLEQLQQTMEGLGYRLINTQVATLGEPDPSEPTQWLYVKDAS